MSQPGSILNDRLNQEVLPLLNYIDEAIKNLKICLANQLGNKAAINLELERALVALEKAKERLKDMETDV